MVQHLGSTAELAKIDVKSAFRTIPVRYKDRELLGIHWQDKYYVDCCLRFGLRSALSIFNQYAVAITTQLSIHQHHTLSGQFSACRQTRNYGVQARTGQDLRSMPLLGLPNCIEQIGRTHYHHYILRHSPRHSQDGIMTAIGQVGGTPETITRMAKYQEEGDQTRTIVPHGQALLRSKSYPSRTYLYKNADRPQHISQETPPSYTSPS